MKTEEEIQAEFKANLVVPAEKPPVQFALAPVGLVGAGKSTVVKPLSESLGTVRVSSDELRKLLKENGHGYEHIKELVIPVLKEFVTEGHSVTLDADCGSPQAIELIKHFSERLGVKVFWLNINPPEQFIINKLMNYQHTWLFKDGEEAVQNYFDQKETRAKEGNTFNFFYEFDTSRSDIDKQVADCLEKIKAELNS